MRNTSGNHTIFKFCHNLLYSMKFSLGIVYCSIINVLTSSEKAFHTSSTRVFTNSLQHKDANIANFVSATSLERKETNEV